MLNRKRLPYVETEGTVLCTTCNKSYEVPKLQKLHSIIITDCPHCGHQNINVVTNSLKFIDEVIDKLEKTKEELLKLKESLAIELQQKGSVDNYPEEFEDGSEYVEPKLL
ncbi:MAG: hypothetical protein PWQ20_1856 [Thermotogaceae bacterium]|jgi:hydrogenase maturation factor HypF (carbamoyltransferase family)|nr:hypothetical protein [Thermotogaceae bacterium]MDN5338786.1 hypothetical protein [Thermotogaceae bacterium]